MFPLPKPYHHLRWAVKLTISLGLLLGLGGLWSIAPTMAAATIRYVIPAGATAGPCTNWTNACELRYALGTVAVAGDEIWVARGIYLPTTGTDRTATFQLKSGVTLYGGFAMTETAREQRDWLANITVLSGDIDDNDLADARGVVIDTKNITGTNAYHVVSSSGVTGTTVLDGFIITGGKAEGIYPDSGGGGMRNAASSPTLANVIFSGNAASYEGGGMYNIDYGSPTLINVAFVNNSAFSGSGMLNRNTSNPVLTNVTFSGNTAANTGGGMYNYASSPRLTEVTFSNNSGNNYGGGMDNEQGSLPTLTHVTFSGNTARFGGGIFSNASDPNLTNVTFNGNSAADYGGGMYNYLHSPTLTNVTFDGNSADVTGSGIYNDNSSPAVYNTLFVKGAHGNNCAGTAFGAFSTANLADDASCGSSAPQSATINLGMLGDYGGDTQTIPLLPGSAAIDAGNPGYCPATDQRGFERIGRCDAGAFEAGGNFYLPLVLR